MLLWSETANVRPHGYTAPVLAAVYKHDKLPYINPPEVVLTSVVGIVTS